MLLPYWQYSSHVSHCWQLTHFPSVMQVNFEEFKEGFVAVLSRSLDFSTSEEESSYLEPGKARMLSGEEGIDVCLVFIDYTAGQTDWIQWNQLFIYPSSLDLLFYICSWALCGGFDKIALCKQCILVDNGKPWGHFFYNLHFQCLTKALTEAETGAIVVYLS